MSYTIDKIGTVHNMNGEFYVEIAPEYREALTGLEGYGYIQVIWWFDRCDNHESRSKLRTQTPYKNGPDNPGIFATRSPERPNPIAITPSFVTNVDIDRGIINLAWIDAIDGTPVLDIKPYVPSIDRVEYPAVPQWCAHWPESVEESGDFDWPAEFNF